MAEEEATSPSPAGLIREFRWRLTPPWCRVARVSQSDRTKIDNLVSFALREAYLWGRAVSRLADRIDKSTNHVDDQVDAMLLAVAYRNVYRAAEMARKHVSADARSSLDRAIASADKSVGNASSVRDMLEHFDDYERGTGNRQQPTVHARERQPNEALARQHSIFFERGTGGYILNVGGAQLEVRMVQEATRGLIEAIDRSGTPDHKPC